MVPHYHQLKAEERLRLGRAGNTISPVPPYSLSPLFIILCTPRGFSSVIIQQVRLVEQAGYVRKKPDERRLSTCEAATQPFWPEAGTSPNANPLGKHPLICRTCRLRHKYQSWKLSPPSLRTPKDPEVLTPRGSADKRWRGMLLITLTGFRNPAASRPFHTLSSFPEEPYRG